MKTNLIAVTTVQHSKLRGSMATELGLTSGNHNLRQSGPQKISHTLWLL
jgi:hypothetical protein